MQRVGVLMPFAPDDPETRMRVAALEQGLRDPDVRVRDAFLQQVADALARCGEIEHRVAGGLRGITALVIHFISAASRRILAAASASSSRALSSSASLLSLALSSLRSATMSRSVGCSSLISVAAFHFRRRLLG
jgi:hypothetical protein